MVATDKYGGFHCNFCARYSKNVHSEGKILCAGPNVVICEDCIIECNKLIHKSKVENLSDEEKKKIRGIKNERST